MHAFRAAHAFDGRRFLPGGATVVLEGARIVGVDGPRVELPADVEVAEYAGTVLPGLIDAHTHLVADSTFGGLERSAALADEDVDAVIRGSLAAQAAGGVTTVRDLGDVRYRTLALRGVDASPRVVAAGPPITTPAGHCHFLGGAVGAVGAVGDADLRAAVAERAARGVDVIKVMASGGFATPGSDQLGAQFTTGELAVLVDEAHRAGLPLVAHAHSLVAMRNALAAGVDGIEHFSGLSEAQGSRIDDELFEEAARRGVFVCPTLGNDRSLHALMPPPPPPVLALLARFGVFSFEEFYASQVRGLARLREHGVRVVAGVDSGMGPPKQHGNLWRMAVEMVEAGYPVAEALAASTSLAAEACGLADETGRLAPGLAADLLVVEGDLSRDVTALGTPRAVLARGVPCTSTAAGGSPPPGDGRRV